jgi:hypothetical protein
MHGRTTIKRTRTVLKRQLVSYPVTCDSTEQIPSWQVNSYWTSPGILRIYGTRIHTTLFKSSFRLLLSETRTIQSTPLSFSLKIRFNIIFPFAPRSTKCPLSLRFLYQTLVRTFSLKSMCPPPSILPDLIIQTVILEEYNLWNSSLCILIRSKHLLSYPIFGHP